MSTPLVYVGGSARSGSTLLERLLAAIPGFCSVGELVFIWERGLRRNDRCGCGARFRDCAFWAQVGEAGFGGWSRVDVNEAARLRACVDRHRNIDRIAGLRRPGKLKAEITAYTALTGRLYQAVREVSGASVIVDSSKHASYALLLRDLPDFELRLVHLVRRSHGVAHSWSKYVLKPGVGDGSSFMSVHPPSWAVGLWIADNLLYDAVAWQLPRATRVRYEDMIADPGAELRRILGELELPEADQAFGFLDAASADLPVTHAFSGNPMRSQRGPLVLRVDDDWRTAMSRPRRAMISAATWPLLRHYGYSTASGVHPRP
ncbi:MAG: sulfotransferase [Streptosporangiaceae bacterium]